ncbi:transcription elongation factor [Nonlabens antarcticus]|uniref:transcription elongation factor n=1 Tax=Nonlabens antarcticus TaxID=392714 RepID=UPI001890CE80|nr:transcription elongation factor [Nonlabens antarcticus]
MSIDTLLSLKSQIHQHCIDLVQAQLDTIQSSLDQLMEAKNSETKSSAGDKYETGMAMIQNQEELYRRQQAEAKGRMNHLKSIDPEKVMIAADKGALIKSDLGFFYLAVGIGKVTMNKQEVFVLSLESPLGKSLKGKRKGDPIIFNGKNSIIENIL